MKLVSCMHEVVKNSLPNFLVKILHIQLTKCIEAKPMMLKSAKDSGYSLCKLHYTVH